MLNVLHLLLNWSLLRDWHLWRKLRLRLARDRRSILHQRLAWLRCAVAPALPFSNLEFDPAPNRLVEACSADTGDHHSAQLKPGDHRP
ncbi:hypothetical protein PC114_g8130 [Phytophthora cactorum]|nr:hypothetical protein PC114_g8130 [Phytophthora cactorum]